MINYRVETFTPFAVLEADGCQVLERIDGSEYGEAGWAVDAEGNEVKFW